MEELLGMKLLTKKAMEKLTTARLLAYKDKLMQVPETADWADGDRSQITKEDYDWQYTYKILKHILSSREHVE